MTENKVGILVVDDEQIVLDSIAKHLKHLDCRLEMVRSAQEALDIFEAGGIDIVLTDLMMPDIDGLELMQMMREKRPDVPVVMITGYATVSTALQATHLGAFDYVAKPFSKKEFLRVIDRAIELVQSGGTPATRATGDTPDGTTRSGDQRTFKTLGDHSWLMVQEDGAVLLGVERSLLIGLGKINSMHLPDKGDEIRQGSVYLRIFTGDMTAHDILSPLTGVVLEVNPKVLINPETAMEDPYGDGWLVRLNPTRFEAEVKVLGL
jgi:CheY-like chemotaxis protein/glycine cleavage system H lipoate-binding protein